MEPIATNVLISSAYSVMETQRVAMTVKKDMSLINKETALLAFKKTAINAMQDNLKFAKLA